MTDTKQSDKFIMGNFIMCKRDATEIFRITHTDAGWHVVVNPERTMTDAAKCFIEAVNNLQRHPLPPAPKEEK